MFTGETLDDTIENLSRQLAASTSQASVEEFWWTPGNTSGEPVYSGSSQEDNSDENETEASERQTSVLGTLSEAMNALSGGTFSPLTFQLNCSWSEASIEDKELCLEKAEEACKIVCDIIAPKDGKSLFQAMLDQSNEPSVSKDLEALMTAFANAPTRRLKLQILSIYAHRYPVKTLIKLHEPFARVTKWQINQARIHAKLHGPGAIQETKKRHRVRVDGAKLDHFIDFINRAHFYQDVAYGVRVLTLESGERIEMPNIVRIVTRSTMVALYMKYCEEESFSDPLSRRTMFRILEVCEASQRTSLRGLDNIAADGAVGFQTIERIVNDLEQVGVEKTWAIETKKRLKNAKLYLSVNYPTHCSMESSLCKDHCVNFALSDPKEKCFQQPCNHNHVMKCDECEDLKLVITDIEDIIQSQCSSSYAHEQKEDMLHDLKQASQDVFSWKAHILRSINQDRAKEDILKKLDENTVLIVMDWAMKYLPTRYREKQSQWFGKRGLSWHISCVISKKDGKLRTQSFAHLFDNCNQEWFSVTSVLENLLKTVHGQNPNISAAYLRSDEGGCYHNNMLIAACQDVSKLTSVKIIGYHFSEPGQGKDICDRIICPMKSALKTYCNEGNDVITASDMRKALEERQVRGTTACVGRIDEGKNSLVIKKVDGFSKFHNFQYEGNGVRLWKAYGIGDGKLIRNNCIYTSHLETSPLLQVVEGQHFFVNGTIRELEIKDENKEKESFEIKMFECPQPSCKKSFDSLVELELHLDLGSHQRDPKEAESLYDNVRRDWASKFSNISNLKLPGKLKTVRESLLFGESAEMSQGWALHVTASSARFPAKVREYLISKFDEGEKTGHKADPAEVEADMRRRRHNDGQRIFAREEWLKSNQIKGFFSRLAASRRKQQLGQDLSVEEVSEEEVNEIENEIEQAELLSSVQKAIGLTHPIIYGDHNICEYFAKRKFYKLTIPLLKEMLTMFEIDYNATDKKQDLLLKIQGLVKECSCFTA